MSVLLKGTISFYEGDGKNLKFVEEGPAAIRLNGNPGDYSGQLILDQENGHHGWAYQYNVNFIKTDPRYYAGNQFTKDFQVSVRFNQVTGDLFMGEWDEVGVYRAKFIFEAEEISG